MNSKSDAQDEKNIVYLAPATLAPAIRTADEAAAQLGMPGIPGPELEKFSYFAFIANVRSTLQEIGAGRAAPVFWPVDSPGEGNKFTPKALTFEATVG